ncbi:hypothetical protein [Paenibacillus sp. GCM10012306]|uniref:hypothetical protein n=1 Tax=Paenibacillus sp. GCM10012306 TaxID=3317342 RepID=UPI00360A57E6
MKPKVVFIEGLPGSGKTTTARLIQEILMEMNVKSQLFLEGDLDHPADYDGVAFFENNQWDELLSTNEEYRALLSRHGIQQGDDGVFLEYRKLKNTYGSDFPDELFNIVFRNDVYELPLEPHKKLIAKRWKSFVDNVLGVSDTFVFDCCFIQNPVTMGMIKYGAEKEEVISYVTDLSTIVDRLDPLLIYVEQDDLEHSFRKAIQERPKEWSTGFVEYYTNQGFGLKNGYKELEGTLQVLKARREWEEDIFNRLPIAKHKVNNSSYAIDQYKQVLAGIVSQYFR